MVELALHAEPLERQHHPRAQVAAACRAARAGSSPASRGSCSRGRDRRSSSGPRPSRPCSAPRSGRSCTRPRRRRRTRTRGRRSTCRRCRSSAGTPPRASRRGADPCRTARASPARRSRRASDSVGTSVNGSRIAVDASGIRIMSLSAIPCQPRIEEPSKPRPSSNAASSNEPIGSVTCCHVPSRSQNFRSTIAALVSRDHSSAARGSTSPSR